MSERFPDRKDPLVIQAEGLYGALNNAFEDWEKREIPPNGYRANFVYDLSLESIKDIQHNPNFGLRQLGIYDLRAPAKWEVGIGELAHRGYLGITGVSMPLATPGQRLILTNEGRKDDYAAYLRHQDGTYTLLMQSPILDHSYVSELLQSAGIQIPDLDLPPDERTLALSKIANQASEFEIVQSHTYPISPTQEIRFEKETVRKEFSDAPRIPTANKRAQPTHKFTYDTFLRAYFTEIAPDGTPLRSQVVTFTGSDAEVNSPSVELITHSVDPLTGKITSDGTETDEGISKELLGYIELGLLDIFDNEQNGEGTQPGGNY